MSTVTELTEEQMNLASDALRGVFDDLKFLATQITPDAAADAFRAMRKLDHGSRVARGLFELVTLPISVRAWSDIPKELWGALKEALAEPGKSVKSRIGIALIVLQHKRLMQKHLDDPETFPCPEFHQASLW